MPHYSVRLHAVAPNAASARTQLRSTFIMPAVTEKKVANHVVALSSAAVLAIYGAGYAKTKEAADRFEQQMSERRPRGPATREERPAPLTAAPAAIADAEPIVAVGELTPSPAGPTATFETTR